MQQIYFKYMFRMASQNHKIPFLLGSSLYGSKCVMVSHFFLNGLLDFLRAMEDKVKTVLSLEPISMIS